MQADALEIMTYSFPVPKYRSWIQLATACLLGAAMPYAFSPYDHKWLAVPVLAAWLLLFTRGHAFATGWVFGLGWFGLGAWWLAPTFHTFGPLAWPWAVLAVACIGAALGLYPALLAWSSHRLAGGSPLIVLIFPILLVGEEWLRGHLFTGLPWTPLGSLLLDTRAIGWAALGGVYGAALLPAVAAVALACLLRPGKRHWGLAAAAVAGLCWLAAPAPYAANGATHRVALVQADIPQRLKWDRRFLNETMFRYVRLTAQAASRSDLIIWPEAAIPMFLERAPEWRQWLFAHMRQWHTAVLFGGLKLDDHDGRGAYNGLYLFEASAPGLQFAGKRHLVPFGEYVPAWIPWVHSLVPNIANFRPATDSGVLRGVNGRYGSLVCYEAIFPEEGRHRARRATVLVNVTNDAWYGHTPATWQHLQAARMRAVETARYLLRAANTGVSAIIGPDGGIRRTIPWFSQGVVLGTYRESSVKTPYLRWGDTPLLLLLPVLLASVWACRKA